MLKIQKKMQSWSSSKAEDEAMLMKSTLDLIVAMLRERSYQMQINTDNTDYIRLTDHKNYIIDLEDVSKDKIVIVIRNLRGEGVAQTIFVTLEWMEWTLA